MARAGRVGMENKHKLTNARLRAPNRFIKFFCFVVAAGKLVHSSRAQRKEGTDLAFNCQLSHCVCSEWCVCLCVFDGKFSAPDLCG